MRSARGVLFPCPGFVTMSWGNAGGMPRKTELFHVVTSACFLVDRDTMAQRLVIMGGYVDLGSVDRAVVAQGHGMPYTGLSPEGGNHGRR